MPARSFPPTPRCRGSLGRTTPGNRLGRYNPQGAASVLALAKHVESAGIPCVPIFWMATEDHDLAEVNQSLLLTNEFQLAPFTLPTDGKPDSPVANIRFAAGTNELVAQAAEVLGESLAADY